MKFTDEFFKFPIRLYDGIAALNAAIEEGLKVDKGEEISPMDVEFVVGVKALRPDHIYSWHDTYNNEHPQEVREGGFPCTAVIDVDGNIFECNWPRKKFEEKLDEFIDKLAAKQKS